MHAVAHVHSPHLSTAHHHPIRRVEKQNRARKTKRMADAVEYFFFSLYFFGKYRFTHTGAPDTGSLALIDRYQKIPSPPP